MVPSTFIAVIIASAAVATVQPQSSPPPAQASPSPSPSISSSPAAPSITFTHLEPHDPKAASGFNVGLNYSYAGSELYIDGVGDVPTRGSVQTSTPTSSMVFREAEGGTPILTVDLDAEYGKIVDQIHKLANNPRSSVHFAELESVIGEDVSAEAALIPLVSSTSKPERLAAAHYVLGNAELDRGNLNAALNDFRSSASLAKSSPNSGDVYALSKLNISTIYSASGNSAMAKVTLSNFNASKTSTSVQAQMEQAINGLSTTTTQTTDPALAMLGEPPPGPQAISDGDFRTFDLVTWHHPRSELRQRLRPVMVSYLGLGYPPEGPCVAQAHVVCLVSELRMLGRPHNGWNARIVLRIVAFVDEGGQDALRLDDATAERLETPPSPTDPWIPLTSPSAAPNATMAIQTDEHVVETGLAAAIQRVAQ